LNAAAFSASIMADLACADVFSFLSFLAGLFVFVTGGYLRSPVVTPEPGIVISFLNSVRPF
jgi:hypothetical protein